MNADDADLAMAQVRLQMLLAKHIEETEPVPPEVGQRAREAHDDPTSIMGNRSR